MSIPFRDTIAPIYDVATKFQCNVFTSSMKFHKTAMLTCVFRVQEILGEHFENSRVSFEEENGRGAPIMDLRSLGHLPECFVIREGFLAICSWPLPLCGRQEHHQTRHRRVFPCCHSAMFDSGQFYLGQFYSGQFLFVCGCVVWVSYVVCFVRECVRGPSSAGQTLRRNSPLRTPLQTVPRTPTRGPPTISRFFPLPLPFSLFFSLSLSLSLSLCFFAPLWGSPRVFSLWGAFTRQPEAQTCTFEGPGLQKHHQN